MSAATMLHNQVRAAGAAGQARGPASVRGSCSRRPRCRQPRVRASQLDASGLAREFHSGVAPILHVRSLWRPHAAGPATQLPRVVVRPRQATLWPDLQELTRYRHLLAELVARNVRIQFEALNLGLLWPSARPLLYVFVFTTFRHLSSAQLGVSIPYELYVYTGLIFWFYFIEAARGSANGLRADAPLLTKVYYPRMLSCAAPVLAGLVSFGASLLPVVVMMAWMGVMPGWRLLLLPAVIVNVMALALGSGLIFASLSLHYRDWDRIMQLSLYPGLWLSPVIYAPEMIPDRLRTLYLMNPMAGALLSFRAVLFDRFDTPLWPCLLSGGVAIAVMAIGLRMFSASERAMVDRV